MSVVREVKQGYWFHLAFDKWAWTCQHTGTPSTAMAVLVFEGEKLVLLGFWLSHVHSYIKSFPPGFLWGFEHMKMQREDQLSSPVLVLGCINIQGLGTRYIMNICCSRLPSHWLTSF